MRLCADLHTHTLASAHAYSTIEENCRAAAERGLCALAGTDHGPVMADAPHEWFFDCQHVLPARIHGVFFLRGSEVNILDWDGRVDLPDRILSKLDFVIASLHRPVLAPGTREEHTRALLAVAKHPHIDCLGHPGQPDYAFDHEAVIAACRASGTLVEVNNHSFTVRPGSDAVCREIAKICMRMEVPVVVNTDAHFSDRIGRADKAVAMLEELGFPERLIVNADPERLRSWVLRRRGVDIFAEER